MIKPIRLLRYAVRPAELPRRQALFWAVAAWEQPVVGPQGTSRGARRLRMMACAPCTNRRPSHVRSRSDRALPGHCCRLNRLGSNFRHPHFYAARRCAGAG